VSLIKKGYIIDIIQSRSTQKKAYITLPEFLRDFTSGKNLRERKIRAEVDSDTSFIFRRLVLPFLASSKYGTKRQTRANIHPYRMGK